MTAYKCHQCGRAAGRKGTCPDCNVALEGVCGVCGAGIKDCTCTTDIVSTKDPKQPH